MQTCHLLGNDPLDTFHKTNRSDPRPLMCLFSAIYGVLPECPLLILTNREELRNRPSAPPQIVSCPQTDSSLSQSPSDSIAWLGGIDLERGGTWLGINQFGVIVAVTNRPRQDLPAEVRSRGLLCRDLLGCRSVESALEESRRQIDRHQFDGFNLLILSQHAAVVVEVVDDVNTIPLSAGVHAITNGPLNDPDDRRIQRARAEIEALLSEDGSLGERLSTAQRICGLGRDSDSPAICLRGSDWGTVSSTVIALAGDPAQSRYLHAPGPPDTVPYDDYSPHLQQLLEMETRPDSSPKSSNH